MELITTYINKDKMAKVYEQSENHYVIEYFINNRLMNKTTHISNVDAENIAENFTNIGGTNPTLLNENA